MWTKNVIRDEKYDEIVSVLQSMEIPFEEHIIARAIAYDTNDVPSHNLRVMEYKNKKGVPVCYAETILRFLDETKDDRIETYMVPNPSNENMRGGWVTEWLVPGDGKRIVRAQVILPTNDFIFSRCHMEDNVSGTSFCDFKKEKFPQYNDKLYFMQNPCTYQDGINEEGKRIPIESKTYAMDEKWIETNKEKIKDLIGKITEDQEKCDEFFSMIFDYAITELKIYNFYSFMTKIVTNPESKTKKTLFIIRGCEKYDK